MKGDYHKYLAKFKIGAERKEATENTLLAFKYVQDIALPDLAPTHAIRLRLVLNFSVFYYEILNSLDRAYNLAKQVIKMRTKQLPQGLEYLHKNGIIHTDIKAASEMDVPCYLPCIIRCRITEFNMSELASLFLAVVPKLDDSAGGKSGERRKSIGPKIEKVQLIDHRRAYNCEIMLTKVKMPLPDMMSVVLALDDSELDLTKWKIL